MKKQEGKWQAWFDGEGVSDDAFVSRDQHLEKLKGSVLEYEGPFEPVADEDWETLNLEAGHPVKERSVPTHSTSTGVRYVRIHELPEALQEAFQHYLRGAAIPDVDGEEGLVAFETDWLDWLYHRRPDRMAVNDNATTSVAVMRAMPNIATEWGLSHIDMAALLGMEIETYRTWSSDPTQAVLGVEQRERASLLLGIYKALVILFPLADRSGRWLHQPNQSLLFQGSVPVDYLRHGGLEGLHAVRQHLDAASQGGFL